jgi:hypothetical protein
MAFKVIVLYTSGNIIKSMKAERFERRLYQASKLGKIGHFMNSSGNEQ